MASAAGGLRYLPVQSMPAEGDAWPWALTVELVIPFLLLCWLLCELVFYGFSLYLHSQLNKLTPPERCVHPHCMTTKSGWGLTHLGLLFLGSGVDAMRACVCICAYVHVLPPLRPPDRLTDRLHTHANAGARSTQNSTWRR